MSHKTVVSSVPVLGLLLVCCGADEPAPVITPGTGIGQISIGMRYQEVSALLGEMTNAIVDARVGIGGYPDRGLDMVLTSPEDSTLTPDAVVIAVGAKTDAFAGFPRPGLARAEIESALGKAPIRAGVIDYYLSGVSVKYGTEGGGDVAKAVGVFTPFSHAPSPPAMQPVQTPGGV